MLSFPKKITGLFLSLFIAFSFIPKETLAQIPSVEWDYKSKGTINGEPQSIVIADNNNLVIAADQDGISVLSPTGMLLKNYPMGSTNVKRVLKGDNGTYYAVGDTISNIMWPSDGWVAKLNDTFGIIWSRKCGGIDHDIFADATLTNDGGIMLAGQSNSKSGDLASVPNGFPGGWFFGWLLKLNSDGQFQWTKIYGNEPEAGNDYYGSQSILKIAALKDGGYIFGAQAVNGTGQAFPIRGAKDGWVVRIDDTGSIIWQKTFGGDVITALSGGTITSDGNFVATGITMAVNGVTNTVFIRKFYGIIAQKFSLEDGRTLWTKAIGTTNTTFTEEPCTLWYGKHTDVTTDGNIVIGAYLSAPLSTMNDLPAMNQTFKGGNDYWIIKLNNNDGSLMWHKLMGDAGLDRCQTLLATPDGGLIAGGNSTGGSHVSHYDSAAIGFTPWLVKLNACPYTYTTNDTICKGASYSFYNEQYDSTGSYSRTFHSASGCDSIYTLNLVVLNKKPQLKADSNILSTDTYPAYTWMKDNVIIPGENNRSYTMTEAGDYRVIVTNEKGCTDTSDIYSYIPYNPDFQLFPIPAHEKIYLKWSKMADGADIVIIGADGKTIYQKHIASTSLDIPLTMFAKDVYMIKVIVADEQVTRQFVKL